MRRKRHQMFAVGCRRLLALQAQHDRLARTVDVGIQEAHTSPLSRPRKSQVHSHGGLTDAALTRCNGHDVLDLLDRLEISLHCVGADIRHQLDRQGRVDPGRRQVGLQTGGQLIVIASHRKSQANAYGGASSSPFQFLQGLRCAEGLP